MQRLGLIFPRKQLDRTCQTEESPCVVAWPWRRNPSLIASIGPQLGAVWGLHRKKKNLGSLILLTIAITFCNPSTRVSGCPGGTGRLGTGEGVCTDSLYTACWRLRKAVLSIALWIYRVRKGWTMLGFVFRVLPGGSKLFLTFSLKRHPHQWSQSVWGRGMTMPPKP